MLKEIEKKVGDGAQAFSRASHISVSDETKTIAAQLISSIIEDPHPSWKIDESQRHAVANAYADGIQLIFYQVAHAEQIKDKDKITSFHFIHWVSRALELPFFCVIRK